jgi:hypothetical protein
MPGTSTPILPQTVKTPAVQIANADGTTAKTIYTASANGALISAITVASTDGTARDLKFYVNNGTTDILLCTVQIPANSGNTNALPPVDVLRSTMCPGLAFDANGNRVIFLEAGDILKAAAGASVTAGQTINIVCPSVGEY